MNSTSFAAMIDLDGAAMQACSVLEQYTVSFSFGDFVKEGSDEFFPIHCAWLLASTLQMLLFFFPLFFVSGARERGR